MKQDVELFRLQYRRQKKLEAIVNSRVLSKPNVKKWQVAIYFVLLPFFVCGTILFLWFFKTPLPLKIFFGLVLLGAIFEFYLRFCLIQTVKCYQSYATVKTRKRCKCIPSCSEYALLSLKTVYPLPFALIKIRKRLYKVCNGEEYKIDFPSKKMSDDYENKL